MLIFQCDGRKPRCLNCELYRDECTFVFHNDKRKPYPKEYIDALHTRINILEGLLKKANIDFDNEPGLPSIPSYPAPELHGGSNAGENSSTSPEQLETDEYIDRLSDRMGQLSVTPSGLRYFGPTSNLHLLSSTVWTKRPYSNLDYRGRAAVEAAGLSFEIDPVKRDHLLQLYWTWHHPFFNIVEISIFLRDMDLYNRGLFDQAKYYSPLLLNAILAVASLLDDTYTDREQYHLKAKILLDLELEEPRITTVQATAILGSHEAVCDRDSRGWIYEGMAIRMAVDLGYQLNCDEWVAKNLISAEEAHMRKVTFWGCFVLDRLWSIYMGRPAALRLSDVLLPRPNEADAMIGDKDSWVPYSAPDQKLPSIWTEYTAPAYLNTTRIHLIKLIEMIAQIQEVMYSGSEELGPALWSFTSKMHVKLTSWFTNLPSPLLCSPNSQRPVVSHIIVLHLQYHATLILLHRPFLKMVATDPSLNHVKEICQVAATAISNLLEKYQKYWYSMRRINVIPVHIIFTAATVHLLNIWNETGLNKINASRGLKICFDSLTEMTAAYETSKRTLAALTHLSKRGQSSTLMESMGTLPYRDLTSDLHVMEDVWKPSMESQLPTVTRSSPPTPQKQQHHQKQLQQQEKQQHEQKEQQENQHHQKEKQQQLHRNTFIDDEAYVNSLNTLTFTTAPGTFASNGTAVTGHGNTSNDSTAAAWEAYAVSANARVQDAAAADNDYASIFSHLSGSGESHNTGHDDNWTSFTPKAEPGSSQFYS